MRGTLAVRHGYTLDDLHGLARLAVHAAGRMGTDWHERYDLAFSAIVTHLYAADGPPRRHELVTAGRLGIYAVVSQHQRHHGYYKAKTYGSTHGPGSSPAFARYWHSDKQSSFESAVIDRLALQAILPALTARQREALAALATVGNHRGAAHALGIQPNTFRHLLGRARKEFFALWHEGEAPSRPYRADRRVCKYEAEVA